MWALLLHVFLAFLTTQVLTLDEYKSFNVPDCILRSGNGTLLVSFSHHLGLNNFQEWNQESSISVYSHTSSDSISRKIISKQ